MGARVWLWYIRRHLPGDIFRRIRWGSSAPLYGQYIEFDPTDCNFLHLGWHRGNSGEVRGGDWDRDPTPLEESFKFRACQQHFQHRVPWRRTGIYDYIMERISERQGPYDGCTNFDDVVRRYENLDLIFQQVLSEGRLRAPRELEPGFRASSGIFIHFDRHSKPVFGGGGEHRLAIAKILQLRRAPAVVGVVHVNAISQQWQMPRTGEADSIRAGGNM